MFGSLEATIYKIKKVQRVERKGSKKKKPFHASIKLTDVKAEN